MVQDIILASGSEIRAKLLKNASVSYRIETADIDEHSIREELDGKSLGTEDIALRLAQAKAIKVAEKNSGALVIGCDQVLDFEGQVFSKPKDIEEAHAQLLALRGKTHRLLSAAVIWQDGQSIWEHLGIVELRMREFSDAYLEEYLNRNWESIRWSVGGYKLEEEGVRLFAGINGDYFNVLGMPLIELLNYLSERGILKT